MIINEKHSGGSEETNETCSRIMYIRNLNQQNHDIEKVLITSATENLYSDEHSSLEGDPSRTYKYVDTCLSFSLPDCRDIMYVRFLFFNLAFNKFPSLFRTRSFVFNALLYMDLSTIFCAFIFHEGQQIVQSN